MPEAGTLNFSAEKSGSPQRFIIFLHVMKSGGMTLQRMLRQRYGPSLPRRFIAFLRQDSAAQSQTPSRLIDSLRAMTMKDRWLGGHFCYGVHELLPKPSTYITMLRNPADRLISLYYYSRATHDSFYHELARDRTIDQFLLKTELHELDNGQVRLIVGNSSDYYTNRTPMGQCTLDMLELAKKHIEESFSFVGVMERFDESVLFLGRRLGWRDSYYLRLNEGDPDGTPRVASPELVAELEQRNRLDCMLYKWVLGRLDDEVRASGDGFTNRLRAFVRNNTRYNLLFRRPYDAYESLKVGIKRALRYRGYLQSRRK